METRTRTHVRIFEILIVLALVGCGKPNVKFLIADDGQSFKQNLSSRYNALDILWVIDNSGSMAPFQKNLTDNFSGFLSSFQRKGYDFHISVTTTDAYLASPAYRNNPALSKFRDGTDATSHTGVFVIDPKTPNLTNIFVTNATQGTSGSGDERAFSSFKAALNNPVNAGFPRTNAFLAVIILSDEDDFSGDGRAENADDHDYNATTLDTVDSYVSYLDTLTLSTPAFRRYNVSAIAVIDQNCLTQHQKDSPSTIIGQRYMQIANETNGVLGSVCDPSFFASLNAIQTRIAELSTQFQLWRVPQVDTIKVYVNGSPVPQDPANGWTYNAANNSIVFHGNAIPPQNASINVDFTPAEILH